MGDRFEGVDRELATELQKIVEANVKKILNQEIGLLLAEAVKKREKPTAEKPRSYWGSWLGR